VGCLDRVPCPPSLPPPPPPPPAPRLCFAWRCSSDGGGERLRAFFCLTRGLCVAGAGFTAGPLVSLYSTLTATGGAGRSMASPVDVNAPLLAEQRVKGPARCVGLHWDSMFAYRSSDDRPSRAGGGTQYT
jgi:hypothetical protein